MSTNETHKKIMDAKKSIQLKLKKYSWILGMTIIDQLENFSLYFILDKNLYFTTYIYIFIFTSKYS